MRVNVYAEEITQQIKIIEKTTKDGSFTGLRFYLHLPVTRQRMGALEPDQIRGPFMHHPGDDDSSAVTFWGKQDLRKVLKKTLKELDKHYAKRKTRRMPK